MDRQDIDALLIGALYGELTPADEARLAAHLESHPTDRGALDDLKSARHAVRESRIFELQLDPPQAISALLLQEAHRRAPKRVVQREETESWFYRFTRSFLAHPAMAAAAMLVLVVGVAGTLYLKKGDQFVDKEIAAPAESAFETSVATAPAAEPTGTVMMNEQAPADRGVLEGAASSGYRVGLDDDKVAIDTVKADTAATRGNAELAKQGVAREREEKSKKSASIIVDTPRPQPKELPEPRAKGAKAADEDDDWNRYGNDGVVGGVGSTTVASGGGGAPSGRSVTAPGAAGPSRNAPAQAAPPPPPPPTVKAPAPAPNMVAQGSTPAPAKPTTTAKPSATKEAEKAEAPSADPAPAKDNSLVAWAKAEHGKTVALANKGDCVGAAKVAVTVLSRAPEYYQQFMATDRLLKKCQAYVTAERDAEAGRNKMRSQKRATSADEPATSR